MKRCRFTLSLTTCLFTACSSSQSPTSSPDAAGADASVQSMDASPSAADGSPADAMTAPDAAMLADASGSGVDAAAGGMDAGTETTYMLQVGYCFTFATATGMDSHSMSCGDFLTLSGANVDLETDPGPDGMGGFCPLMGTFTTLASVPSSFAACAWTNYVEGIGGLANTGYIVRDAAHAHHYKMRVISNTQPTLIFSFAMID
jgi:hypothetical protein